MPPHDPKLFPPDETGFAPHDLTDGRKPFDWSSRWSREAIKSMRVEASYLMILLAVGVAVLAREFNTLPRGQEPLPLVDFSQIAWSAGLIGGTAFGIKWFYHGVAKGLWHLDRRYWRCFSPIVSAILAFFTSLILFKETIVEAHEPGLSLSLKTAFTAFLAGYFSDSAFGKLAEVASVLFGTSERGERTNRKPEKAGDG